MIVSQHPRVDEAAIQLQDYLRRLEEWLTTNRMSAEGSKSSLTVATPHNTEYRYKPTITLMGQTIPVTNDKNILGVTIDRGWTFRQHTQDINAKAKSRLNVIKGPISYVVWALKRVLDGLIQTVCTPSRDICQFSMAA